MTFSELRDSVHAARRLAEPAQRYQALLSLLDALRSLPSSLSGKRLLGQALSQAGLAAVETGLQLEGLAQLREGVALLTAPPPVSAQTLARGVAHDLRNPIAAVQMNGELLATGLNLPADELRDIGVGMVRLSQRMLSVIDSHNDYQQLQGGEWTPQRRPFSLKTALTTAAQSAQLVADARGASLELDFVDETVVGDIEAVSRAVGTVLCHAVSHTTASGTARLGVAYGEGHVLIRISDDGPPPGGGQLCVNLGGLPGRRAPGDASNLPLTVARLSIERMGGALSCRPQPEGGALFTLRLPIKA